MAQAGVRDSDYHILMDCKLEDIQYILLYVLLNPAYKIVLGVVSALYSL